MNQTIEEKNKELVLKAFDPLFDKRDYGTAEGYWSPNYIQHSAHIELGRKGLCGFWTFANRPRSAISISANALR
jgi:predicted SnoaL-like aldol condensation-catalyzing enzyme